MLAKHVAESYRSWHPHALARDVCGVCVGESAVSGLRHGVARGEAPAGAACVGGAGK